MNRVGLGTLALMIGIPAIASETITYTYDAKGRVVSVAHSGSVNSGAQSTYSFDKADNRTQVTSVVSGGSPPPSFAIGNAATVIEGGVLSFTVTKTGATGSSYSVNYATGGGTATVSSDYTPTSGTLNFASADVTKTITVTTIDDAVVESPETAQISLSAPTGGATITTATGSGTINDNDSAPNNPPVANADSASMQQCTSKQVNVIANDTDPDGDLPLSLGFSFTGSGAAYASYVSSTTLQFDAPGGAATYAVGYTVTDSRGASSAGTLTVSVLASQPCN